MSKPNLIEVSEGTPCYITKSHRVGSSPDLNNSTADLVVDSQPLH